MRLTWVCLLILCIGCVKQISSGTVVGIQYQPAYDSQEESGSIPIGNGQSIPIYQTVHHSARCFVKFEHNGNARTVEITCEQAQMLKIGQEYVVQGEKDAN